MKPRTAILAALRREVEGLARAAGLEARTVRPGAPRSLTAMWEGFDLVIAATGIGRIRATQGCDAVVARFRPERIILCGTAGSLSPALLPLDLVVPEAIASCSDEPGSARCRAADAGLRASLLAAAAAAVPMARVHAGTMVAADRPVLDVLERDRLRDRYGAVAVDMESAAAAEGAASHGVAWAVIKAVTDAADAAAAASFEGHLDAAAERLAAVLLRFLGNEASLRIGHPPSSP